MNNNELKNYFNIVTCHFKDFLFEEDEFHWQHARIDGGHYTCMRFDNEVKIFSGVIHHSMFHHSSIKPVLEFEM